ncbi:MAG TPA: beta-ketoacyl-ACP synthase II [Acidimicrobiia bacterium]|nr:beta-ketoacyl-ACP synthase II [Acidimicrobiia bacterium]
MTVGAHSPTTDWAGRPRVAVTGVGMKTPVGNDVESFWKGLLAARSAAAPIEAFDASPLGVRFACEVRDLEPEVYVEPKEARRLDRTALLGLAAGLDAIADAGEIGAEPARSAVVAGTGIGGLQTFVDQQQVYLEKGPERVSPFLVPMLMPNATAAHLSMRLGWTGPSLCVTTACAAGANSIGEGARLVRDGIADVVLAGGTEAPLTPVTMAAFWRMGALSTRNDEPERASRPFDVDRDGFVMGEGAGFVTLERWDHATARGARIYGEVVGYGANCDAHHITAPDPQGAGAVACMRLALKDANLDPDAIGHVNAHGTSTPMNDAIEAAAIREVFGSPGPPVTSIKGVTGHLVGGAGAVETIAALLAARCGEVPPTGNHDTTDPEVTIDVVAGGVREIGVAPAVTNSFGFGGHNATLVVAPAP